MHQPLAQRDVTVRICLSKILGRVSLTPAVKKGLRRIHEQRGRSYFLFCVVVMSAIKRRCVDNWLKHRTRLSIRVDCAIELALTVIAPSHHRQYLASLRVKSNKRSLQCAGRNRLDLPLSKDLIQRTQRIINRFVSSSLEIHVDGCVYAIRLASEIPRRQLS